MFSTSTASGAAWLRRLDPRVRLIAAAALSIELAVATRWGVLTAGLALALALAACARLPARVILPRMLALNALVGVLAVLMALCMPGDDVVRVGPAALSVQGLRHAGQIALKSNSIMLLVAVLLGTLSPERMGHALNRLAAPQKLTQLFLFTARYTSVLYREYERLAAAMKVRCFRPGMNRHTYRTMGYLVGMLLVRSFDRSERILSAMLCRGFEGRYHVLDRLSFRRADAAFSAAAAVAAAAILWAEAA